MLSRTPHIKDKVYFIHNQHGILSGVVREIHEDSVVLAYKTPDKNICTVKLEDLYGSKYAAEDNLKNSTYDLSFIPEKLQAQYVEVKNYHQFMEFLFANLKDDAVETAIRLAKTITGSDMSVYYEDPEIREIPWNDGLDVNF